MTENIVTGKKYRILTDAANDIWDRISFWSKASDVQYDDNTTAEANKAVAILKRNASYTVGTVAYEPSAPSWVLLKCTQAGTTSAVIPSTYSTISAVGTVITDGTARFTVYDVRPSGTLSNSEYQVPAMSLVSGLDSELTANGNKFYFDYKNSKYGYNTSASRAAATFVPFGGTNQKDYIIKNAQFQDGYSFGAISYIQKKNVYTYCKTEAPTIVVAVARGYEDENHYVDGVVPIATNVVGNGQILVFNSTRIQTPPSQNNFFTYVGFAKTGTTSYTWSTSESSPVSLPRDGASYTIYARMGITYIFSSYVGEYVGKQRLDNVCLITADLSI